MTLRGFLPLPLGLVKDVSTVNVDMKSRSDDMEKWPLVYSPLQRCYASERFDCSKLLTVITTHSQAYL